jgi:hypothetical protein
MKKFLITLFILVLLGAAVFFLGWAQFSVPVGAYGLLYSKTHGADPHPIQSGEFRWIWYKLIPTNVTISVFRLEPEHYNINASGYLPSGNVYAAFAGEQVDFSWDFSASITFSIRPDALSSVVSENNINTQDDLALFQRDLAWTIESFILHSLGSIEDPGELEAFMAGFDEKLEQMTLEKFPVIHDFSCLVKTARFPDFSLYKQVRGLYEEYIAMQRNYAAASINRKAEARVETQLRFEELERYGELLTKYPILLEYLARQNALQDDR